MSVETQPADIDRPQKTGARWLARANPLLVFALILILVFAWQWYDTRSEIAGLRHELARRLAEADTSGKEARNTATDAVEAGRRAETKLDFLEDKLAESQSQQVALEALYQELTRSRDEAMLEEVEQLLLIANQQLQLASNVKSALIAMQEADSRLQRTERPQLASLRKTIAKDMDLLKSVPYVDTAEISMRLDNLVASVDTLPLAMEFRPPESASPPSSVPVSENVWLRFLHQVWEDFKRLVRIQHMDSPDVALLSPSQAYFLRENLKLRLLSARYALLAHNGSSFKADLDASREQIRRYYDTQAQPVVDFREALQQLGETDIGAELPGISASLDAVRNYRLTRDRGNR